ncbi:Ldh family oxidoreductase [Candidatus Woesearchaeota archaeon]|nr:Ldh family oxidoreductase [Candidatus Woesearchaeota archaeon]
MRLVPLDRLERFMEKVFSGLGVPAADAKVCAEVLAAADRHGIGSHGINRLKPIYYDRIRAGILFPKTRFEVVREGPATAVVDGHDGMGFVIAKRAMGLAITKAKMYGIGMVAVRNSSHYGIAGYYAIQAAKAGMIGITGTNARPSIAPTFGVENMLGTNPLTVGIPTDEGFPFVIDCATSVSQRGKIEVYAREGKPLPPGWVIRRDGTSAADAKLTLRELTSGDAALVPLGGVGEETAGYKGYGYATVVEILSAALQAGPFMKALCGMEDGKPAPYHLGHFFIAIDVAAFTDPSGFRKRAGDILRALRASARAPGERRIYTAWEKEYLVSLERDRKGVPVNAPLQAEIRQMASKLGITELPF